jgi:hypothetical protein
MTRISILCAASTICAAYVAGTAMASASIGQTDVGTLTVSRPSLQTSRAIALNPQPLPPLRLPTPRTFPPTRTTPKYQDLTPGSKGKHDDWFAPVNKPGQAN